MALHDEMQRVAGIAIVEHDLAALEPAAVCCSQHVSAFDTVEQLHQRGHDQVSHGPDGPTTAPSGPRAPVAARTSPSHATAVLAAASAAALGQTVGRTERA